MEHNKITLEKFGVIGNEITTTNAEGQFEKVWESFLKTYSGGQIVAVYTDYESDATGKFTFMVGIKTSLDNKARIFSGGNYFVFHLADRSEVVKCWQDIWKSGLDRSYIADFEFYNDDGSVDIYIGVR